MTWFKVDDGFAFHPKAIMAGNAALGLWVRAGAWCGANLTDGALPRHMIGTFGAQKRDADKLCSVGLWVETDGGYQFHEWGQMQPTKAEVEAERAANRARQKEWRDKKRNGVTDTVTNAASNDAPTRPDPTPIEEPKGSSVEIREDVKSLCDLLADLIEANGSLRPSVGKAWTDSARRMIDKDKREPDKAANLIRWSQGNTFWRKNILSMPTFREKYDQLRLAALEEWDKNKSAPVTPDGGINVDAILGRDVWAPGTPPEGLDVAGEIAWKKEQRAKRQAERLEEAKRKMGNIA
jgi:hypothetical protein